MIVRRAEMSTVGFFQELYAIVFGLGLAISVEQVIDLGNDTVPVAGEHIPVFLAYLNIAFALAHASVRYLELAYIDQLAGALSRRRVIGDLVLGVGHFLWLLALPFLVTRPSAFAVAAIALLVGRPTRDALVALGKARMLLFDRKVAAVHGLTIAVFVTGLLATLGLTGDAELWTMRLTALCGSLVFGLGLYVSAFDFFFASRGGDESAPVAKA